MTLNLDNKPRTLNTRDLHLRPLAADDAAAMFAMLSDQETVKYWSNQPLSEVEQAKISLQKDLESDAKGDSISWAVCLRNQHEMIGKCVLFHFSQDNHRAEVGFILNRNYWRHGLMYQAIEAVIGVAFKQLGLHRLEADVDPGNAASLALLEKLGFEREGLLRDRWYIGKQWYDSVMMGLLNPDRI